MSEAEEMHWRALTGFEKALGRNYKWTLNTVNNLGNLYVHQDKLEVYRGRWQATRNVSGWSTHGVVVSV